MELAALSSKGVCIDGIHASAELSQTGGGEVPNTQADDEMSSLVTSPRSPMRSQKSKPDFFIMFEESDNSCYYNIKPNCQKENICTDKQLYSNFYSSGTAHFDGILPLQIILSLIYVNSPNTLCISIYQPLVKLTKPGSFVFLLF